MGYWLEENNFGDEILLTQKLTNSKSKLIHGVIFGLIWWDNQV
jgi:hypothetical protein